MMKCLLCRGAVQTEVAKYRRHLKEIHNVWFFINWIIEKTLEQNATDTLEDTDDEKEEMDGEGMPKVLEKNFCWFTQLLSRKVAGFN